MDFSDYIIVAQNQETNVICVRLGFLEDTLIIVEPDIWPEDLSTWLDEHIQNTFNKDASRGAVNEPTGADEV
jgi:hypothetical protein